MEQLYNELSNNDSLNDDNFLLACLNAYKRCFRPYKSFKDGKRYSNYYEFLTTSRSIDKTEIDRKSYENFYVKMTNEWIDSIKNTEDIDEYDIEGLYYLRIKAELKRVSPVKTLKDVERLYKKLERKIGGNINNFFWRHIQNDSRYSNFEEALKSFTHISSKYTKYGEKGIKQVDYRLYINCANKNIFNLTNMYIECCKKRNIPYLIKFTTDSTRQEKFLVYTSKENLEENIKILKEIGEKNPEIKSNCGKESPITASIDGWIGLGSEPENEKLESKYSFNSLRAKVLEEAAEKTVINYIKRNTDRKYNYRGTIVSLADFILLASSKVIIEQMQKTKTYTDGKDNIYDNNYRRKLIETLATSQESNIIIGFKKLEELNNKNLTIFENKNPLFELNMPNGQYFYCSIEIVDKIVKSLVDIIVEIEPNFIELYRSEIRKMCPKYHIDPNNFALNIEALQDFKIIKEDTTTEKDLYREVNSIIFDIIVCADEGINTVKIEKLIEKAIKTIGIIKEKYEDYDTALLLAKNLNMGIKTFEDKTKKRLEKARHLKKSEKQIKLEEIIGHMEGISEAHKELLIENIRENSYQEEEKPHPKHF